MSTQSAPDLEHLLALLADRALEGLSPGRAAELAGLLGSLPDLDDEALDRTAAAIDLALAPAPDGALSAGLRRAVLADLELRAGGDPATRTAARAAPRRATSPPVFSAVAADAPPLPAPGAAAGETGPFFGEPETAAAAPALPRRAAPSRRLRERGMGGAIGMAGWILAGLLVALWSAARLSGLGGPDAAVLRAADAASLTLKAGPGQEADRLRGEITWSASRNAGVLRVEGLAPNDPTARRYQAWVIDTAAKERILPAAVFDVSAGDGAVQVLLQPPLPVAEAGRFAVTLEGPLGALRPSGKLEKPVAIAAPE